MKKMKKRALIGLLFAAIVGAYTAKLIDVNTKLKKEIKPLEEKFKYTALTAPFKIIKIDGLDEKIILDYGGALDSILKERNQYLKKIPGIVAFWEVELEYNNKKPEPCPRIFTLCLNPFAKIPSYQK